MSDAQRGPIAIESAPWEEFREGARFALKFRILSNTREDRRKSGVSYEERAPLKQSAPFHSRWRARRRAGCTGALMIIHRAASTPLTLPFDVSVAGGSGAIGLLVTAVTRGR